MCAEMTRWGNPTVIRLYVDPEHVEVDPDHVVAAKE
jgi:hypothetical protein